jgi:hypothetical protein
MQRTAKLQARLDSAFTNYLTLTAALRDDLAAMLAQESPSLHWRRNFVRASAALLEGHAYCLTQICRLGVSLSPASFSAKERKAVANPDSIGANERLKLTLRVAYKLFQLHPAPHFGGAAWRNAQRVMLKRHKLMHPRTPRDLGIATSTWQQLKRGIVWLMQQFCDFLSLAQARYGT